jgi:hypothetical protein
VTRPVAAHPNFVSRTWYSLFTLTETGTMTLRRFGLALFALALAAAAIQVPACEFDPTSPSPDIRPAQHGAVPGVQGPAGSADVAQPVV